MRAAVILQQVEYSVFDGFVVALLLICFSVKVVSLLILLDSDR